MHLGRLQYIDPKWRSCRRYFNLNLSLQWRKWLLNRGSLTKRLEGLCGSGFHIRCLHQGWARPLPSETKSLKLHNGQWTIVRESLLLHNNTPLLYGRSIIPAQVLRGKKQLFRTLGNQSIGNLIFSDPMMHQGEMEIAKVNFSLADVESIWARRTVFLLGQSPLLVTEFFLPVISDEFFS